MTKKFMLQSEITKEINEKTKDFRPKDFTVYNQDGAWQIKFIYLEIYAYELHIKRKRIRRFVTLNAAGNCLRDMGVNEFKVIL